MSTSQIVHIPFAAGIDDRVDPKQAPAGTLSTLKNAYFSRSGEIAKRPGLDGIGPIDTDGVSFAAERLFVHGDTLCCVGTNGYIYTYIESQVRWKRGPSALRMEATTGPVTGSMASANQAQVAYFGGFVVYVWHVGSPDAPGSIYLKVTEASTGAHVVNPTRVSATGFSPRVVAVDGAAYVAWAEGSVGARSLLALKINLSGAFTVSAPLTLVAAGLNGAASASFDMSAMNDATNVLCFAWANDIFGLRVAIADSSLTLTSGIYNYGVGGLCDNVSVSSTPWATGGIMFVSYRSGAATWRTGAWDWYGPALVVGSDIVVAGATTGTSYASGNSILAVGNDEAILVLNGHVRTYQPSTASLIHSAIAYDGQLLSRPFLLGGRYYMLCGAERGKPDTYVASVVMVDTNYPNLGAGVLGVSPAGNVSMRQFGAITGNCPDVALVSSTEARAVFLTVALEYSELRPPQDSIEYATIRTGGSPRSIEVLGSVLFAGAAPWWYDGVEAHDVGFYGGLPVLASSATGGALVAAGTYVVGIVYQRVDSSGVLHRSPMYQAQIVLSALATAIDVYGSNVISCAKASAASGVHLSLYQSDNFGTVLFQYSNPPLRAVLLNDNSVVGATATVLVNGIFDITPRVPGYTTGDVLDDVAPPSFTDVCTHRGRVFAIGGDQRTVWFSKLIADEPKVFPGFNEALTVRADDGSDIVALGSLDSVLVIWTEQGVYYLEGDGPGPTGFPTDYGSPRKIAADIGCKTPLSVVSCQLGLLFQGTDGQIWMLTRSLSLEPVGRAIQDQIALYPRVRSATLVENFDQVRFACTNAAGDAGTTFVWDYSPGVKQWSTYEHGVVISACTWKNRYCCLRSFGAIYVENEASWLDNYAWYSMVVETNWFGGPTTWQRVRAVQTVGDYKSAHGFTVELAVDHSPTYQQVATFTEAEVLVNQGRATVRLGAQNGMNPRCKAMRLRITDTAPAVVGTGESQRWSGFALEILPQPGLSRHGAANAKR